MTIVSIVLGAMPACCGKMVDKRKIFGGISVLLGVLGMFMPAIGAMAGSSGTVNKVCKCYDKEGCPCDDAEKKALKTFLGTLGIFFAYLFALGWLAIILGIVGISMGGASCCGCCKAKDAAPAVATGTIVQG